MDTLAHALIYLALALFFLGMFRRLNSPIDLRSAGWFCLVLAVIIIAPEWLK